MCDFELQIRYGGPQADEEEEAQRKAEERERKKAEVRKRLEEQGKAGKKAKKGFLTPERKKKLRKLLMMKAAEDLKQQQLLKEKERQKVLAERIIPIPVLDTIDDHGKLEQIYNEIWARVCTLEEEKYDINQLVLAFESEINELTIAVNDLRGKFVKPSLKKVSKYDNKFKKMAEQGKKEDKTDLRSNLKVVKKENVFTQLANKKKENKPDWSHKNKDSKKEEKGEKEEDVVISSDEPGAEEVKEEEIFEEEEEEEEEEGEEEEEE